MGIGKNAESCVCVSVHPWVCTCERADMCVRTFDCLHSSLSGCVCACVSVCVCVCVSLCAHMCLIACNDGHVGVCMYVSYVKLNIVMFSAEPKLIKHDV